MVGVLNYKSFQRGSILGFFDLRYHGLVVKGCRLMIGQNGYWMAFPQKEGTDKDGKIQYFDQMYLTKLAKPHGIRPALQGEVNVLDNKQIGFLEESTGKPAS